VFPRGRDIEQEPRAGKQKNVESGIAQGSQSRPKHETRLRVRDSNKDGWRLIRAPRRNEEIKEPGICQSAPEPERFPQEFPQDMEAGTQTLERRIADVMIRNIDKSSLKKNL
jgi:hypothetical protein